MTHRASELRIGPSAKRASFAIGAKGDVAELPAARRGIPLDLVPLLSPYKGKGRLTLRVEHMPRTARFSAGRNNGDESWSLNFDELDELEYLLPEGAANAHTLALRVVAHDDTGASTLVVLDVPITPGGAEPMPEPEPRRAPAKVVSTADNIALQTLREELAKAATTLAGREAELANARQRMELAEAEIARKDKTLAGRDTELAEARQRVGRAEAEAASKDNALAGARAARTGDTDTRIAAIAAKAAAELAHARDEWQEDQNTRIAELEERARTRMEDARESWRREMRDALSKAEASWKASEADRLAAAEKQWRTQANKTLAEAQVGVDKQLCESETELRRLREELTRTEELVAKRDAELTQMRTASEAAHRRERHDFDTALMKAETNWKTNEVHRLAVAEKRWQDETAGHLAAAKARYETAEFSLAELRRKTREQGGASIETLRNELAMVRASLDNRDAELSRLRAVFERDRGDTPEAGRRERRGPARSGRSLMRDVVIVMTVVIAFGLFYSRIVALLPYEWQAVLPTFAMQDSVPAGVPSTPEKPAPAPSIVHDTAMVTRDVNLREGPSTDTDIIATLPRGVEVEKIKQDGNWTLVQARGNDDSSNIQKGWIYNSYMKAAGERPEKPAAADNDKGRSP